jgi:hypothetical protein
MKFNYLLLASILFVACQPNTKNETKEDIFGETFNSYAKKLSKNKDIVLEKTVYYQDSSSDLTITDIDWENEFALFNTYNFNHIQQQGDLVIDTTFDERTKRYLMRGMRMGTGAGLQNLYLVLDSNRQMIQVRIVDHQKSWLMQSETELFWDVQGEYTIEKNETARFGEDSQLKVFAKWK